jgi:DNA replication protein DnaC
MAISGWAFGSPQLFLYSPLNGARWFGLSPSEAPMIALPDSKTMDAVSLIGSSLGARWESRSSWVESMCITTARLPLPATLEDLDLSPSRGLDHRLVLQLAEGEWVHQHFNILALGSTGVGKTFPACALTHAMCRHSFTVRYQCTSRLLHQITLGHVDGFYPQLLDSFSHVQFLVLDDWLRDPLTRLQSQDMLEILDDRYDRSSKLVATHVLIAEWHARFPDPTIAEAILDRLVHNAYRLALTGESQRKSDSPFCPYRPPDAQ